MYIHVYMKKSGGPEQKGILRTAVSSLLALISAVQHNLLWDPTAGLLASGSEANLVVQLARFFYIYIYGRCTYRIFLNVSTRFFFTVTSSTFHGTHCERWIHNGKVQSSSSWSCSLTSLLETDRDTEVSHHSLPLLLLCSVE